MAAELSTDERVARRRLGRGRQDPPESGRGDHLAPLAGADLEADEGHGERQRGGGGPHDRGVHEDEQRHAHRGTEEEGGDPGQGPGEQLAWRDLVEPIGGPVALAA